MASDNGHSLVYPTGSHAHSVSVFIQLDLLGSWGMLRMSFFLPAAAGNNCFNVVCMELRDDFLVMLMYLSVCRPINVPARLPAHVASYV